MELTRNNMANRLRKEKGQVTFEKADGTKRIMNCTLMPKFLPEQLDFKEYLEKTEKNPDTLAVWDLDKNDWRSFRIDRIEEVVWT